MWGQKIGTLRAKDLRKNASIFLGGGSTLAPPTLLVIRVVLLHVWRFAQSFFSPTECHAIIGTELSVLYNTSNNSQFIKSRTKHGLYQFIAQFISLFPIRYFHPFCRQICLPFCLPFILCIWYYWIKELHELKNCMEKVN